MKALFSVRTFVAVAVAVAAATSGISPASAQPAPPPPAASALPAGIVPGSTLAQVVKLVQAGVDVTTIQSYIVNAQSPFNLDADKIIFLKDEGLPTNLINAMMDRDKALYASTVTPPPAPPAAPVTPVATSAPDAVTTDTPDTAPPPEEITLNYFYDTLAPYGSWVNVDGYGQCWRPTTVIYDAAWRPYGDRGHWVYTDYGWYWDSDYAWGSHSITDDGSTVLRLAGAGIQTPSGRRRGCFGVMTTITAAGRRCRPLPYSGRASASSTGAPP
jgi:hypothetical protein